MKRNGYSLLLIGLLLLAGLAIAITVLNPNVEADAAAVEAANQLYVGGHYAEAAQLYEGQIARGVQDSAVFYNLGNVYFQQGDLGRAVLNLERAAQLNPRDGDIEANLALVREQTTELFAEEAAGPLVAVAQVSERLTENETAVLVLGFWFLLGFLFLAWRQTKSERARKGLQYAAAVVLILLLLFGVSLASRTFLAQTLPSGVVVSPTVAVSSGPGAEFATEYSLSGGTAVNLVEQQGNWIRLDVPTGVEATWVPAEAVETVATVQAAVS
jgi:tetratricopeptide (TPR) repeat protein